MPTSAPLDRLSGFPRPVVWNSWRASAPLFPIRVLLLDANGVVVSANRQALELFEFDPDGQHFSAAIRAPAIVEAVAHSAARTASRMRADYEQRVPVPRSFEAYISAITGDAGEPAALILLRDLTREQQIERMRADFVANASHELRTPLASLLGFIETLQGAAKNDEVARERFLDLMRTQAERMRRLIDDLLSLEPHRDECASAAVRHGRSRAGGAPCARHALGPRAREPAWRSRSTINEPMPVQGDWDELVQVVQNLVENAIKYASTRQAGRDHRAAATAITAS